MKKRIIPFVEIKKKVQINEELFLIFISKPTDFSFKPGQYVTLGINCIERAYSVVSAPYEDVIEIFVEFISDGKLENMSCCIIVKLIINRKNFNW